MLAVNVSAIVLGAGVLVLGASTVLMSISLPAFKWKRWHRRPWRRSAKRPAPIQATHRPFTVSRSTGRPSPLALPPPAARQPVNAFGRPHRQMMFFQDIHPRDEEVAEAEATIGHLLDTDPQLLARLMMQWIHEPNTDHASRGGA